MKLAFYKGSRRWYHRIVEWWTHGPYSHVELMIVEKDGRWLAGSATPSDGVRLIWRTFKPEHWKIIDCPIGNPLHAQVFFEKAVGAKYDYLGILGFVLRRGQHFEHRWFCSEVISGAIGLRNPWRYCPNTLYDVLVSLNNGKYK